MSRTDGRSRSLHLTLGRIEETQAIGRHGVPVASSTAVECDRRAKLVCARGSGQVAPNRPRIDLELAGQRNVRGPSVRL